MRLGYWATSRNAFNNSVLRLVKHDYLVRDEVPFRTEGYVYSISARGAAELAGLGEYYTGLRAVQLMGIFRKRSTTPSTSTKFIWP